jgi:hypothetical protein
MTRYANIITARKVWTCARCKKEIAKGEKYEHSYATGGVSVHRTCAQCVAIRATTAGFTRLLR